VRGFIRIFVAVLVLASIPPTPVAPVLADPPAPASGLRPSPTTEPDPPPPRPSPADCASSAGVVERGDVVAGTEGPDSIDCSGASAAKVIVGLGGDDTLTGSRFADRLLAGPGDDTMAGGRGADELHGGRGADAVTFSQAPRAVTADLETGEATGEGGDRIESVRRLVGSRHDDILLGSEGDEALRGGRGADYLAARGGDDVLHGGRGTDTLIGGAGRDTLTAGESRDACAGGIGRDTTRQCEALSIGEAMSVTLFAPAETVIGVGFHESLFDSAQEISPDGGLLLNANPAKFAPSDRTADGLDHVVMGSRGRPTPATSSVDVVVASSSPVLSPVTGTVVQVFPYLLYCRAWDWELVIEPVGHPDARVIVLHFVGPEVEPGDRVVAGVTPVGTSWTNDSPGAQENEFFADEFPHIHIEVERGIEPPVPGCLSAR
jgi:hypothetical protein